MAEEQSKEEIILEAEKKLCSDSNHRPLSFDMILLQNGIPFKEIRDVRFFDWVQHKNENPKAFSKDNFSLDNSYFFYRVAKSYSFNQIPQFSVYNDEYSYDSKLSAVCNNFAFFKFGGIPFQCSHKIPEMYNYIYSSNPKPEDRYMFEMRYGIKIDNVYISLSELLSAGRNGFLSMVDDFMVVGNYNNTILTIFDNDLDYSMRDSSEKYNCHFKPVFCINYGVPVKYIKTVDDSKPMQNAFVRECQIEYDMQRKQVLQKLNNVFAVPVVKDNSISGYPTEIDFIVKTGLREFTFLSYDRFYNNGDLWIMKVNYSLDGADPKSVIKKCSFQNLQQNINVIKYTRACHFNKMYARKR